MNISVATIQKLPLHDARLSSISITPTAAGLQVRLSIEINEDEDMEPFQSLGLQQRGIDFLFSKCWAAKCSLLGLVSENETIDDWIVQLDGPLLRELRAAGFAHNLPLSEHHITSSGGSKIQIVTEDVCVTSPTH